MAELIKDSDFKMVAEGVRPDAKRRVVLSKIPEHKGIIYHIYSNSMGQIVLDPQITIPASEAWLFENPEAFASVRRGLADAAQGRVTKVKLDTL